MIEGVRIENCWFGPGVVIPVGSQPTMGELLDAVPWVWPAPSGPTGRCVTVTLGRVRLPMAGVGVIEEVEALQAGRLDKMLLQMLLLIQQHYALEGARGR